MREIRTSGLTSGDGKRSVAAWPKPPRPSSTLQVKGRKRHALVDTDGRALLLHAHPADISGSGCSGSSAQRLPPVLAVRPDGLGTAPTTPSVSLPPPTSWSRSCAST